MSPTIWNSRLSPRNGVVNSAVHCLRTDICALGIGYCNFASPRDGVVNLKILYHSFHSPFKYFLSFYYYNFTLPCSKFT